MFEKFQNPLALAARLLLAAVYLPAGIGKISGFAGTVGYISSVGLPLPTVAAALAVVLEVAGGLALIAGFQTRLAALALAVFTLVASVFFHAYWSAPAEQAFVQQLMFFKNVGIIGGLLALTAFGAGALSVDARRKG